MTYTGDCLDILPTLKANTIQCCVTSPPYYGLRDYGVDGQLGLEKTPSDYVEKIVAVFREVRRVLRDDGTLWLNLGDSYAGGGKGIGSDHGKAVFTDNDIPKTNWRKSDKDNNKNGEWCNINGVGYISDLKPKDLIGIPWLVAFALQADGWYLRQDIIWHKPNTMPESVKDRCTKAHEYIFLLTKSAKYFYDQEAVKERGTPQHPSALSFQRDTKEDLIPGQSYRQHRKDRVGGISHKERGQHSEGGERPDSPFRNRRSVWTITTKPFKEAHFATFPPEIPEICIKAGTSEKGCCPECGSPWERVTDISYLQHRKAGKWCDRGQDERGLNRSESQYKYGSVTKIATTTGWRPTCAHDHEPIPCTVLDPFSGSGTTGNVAERLGRHFIGIELNPAYAEMSNKRIDAARLPLMEAL